MACPCAPAVESSALHASSRSSSSLLASGSSSLPFAPLPHGESKRNKFRPARLPMLQGLAGCSERFLSIKEHWRCSESVASRVAKESKVCSAPVLEDDKVTQEGGPSWSRLGRLLSPLMPGELELAGASGADCATEHLWSPVLVGIPEDDIVGNGLIPYNFSFSAAVQSTPPPRQKQEESDRQKYYVNIGYAIRTLREELPTMFYKDVTYDIYREDILFRDPRNAFGGLDNYKLIFWALRFHGRIFFKALWVDILRVWQPSDNVIMVRWQVRGVPRVPWEAQGIFDGTSEYKLDKDGKIYEHKVDNVALNSGPKFKVPTVADLLRVGACPSTPKPTFFEKTGAVFWSMLPYLLQFTWVRYYLALKGTMGLKNAKQKHFIGVQGSTSALRLTSWLSVQDQV